MTNEEKLKLVAEYMEYDIIDNICYSDGLPSIPVRDLIYHTSYDWQIPVWQKVYKELTKTKTDKAFHVIIHYEQRLHEGTPLDSFEILVQAIQFLNQIKNKDK